MSTSGRRRLVAGSSCQLLALVSLLAMVSLGHSRDTTAGVVQRSRMKIQGGWNEVKSGWPVADRDYFIATEKGHHFVETQDLPKNLKQDLRVTFEYYYSYTRTQPVLQMLPCRQNIYLMNERSEDKSNEWIKHVYRVNHLDCNKRNHLAYNVLLHDPGDVFAWRLLKIESVEEEEDFVTTLPIENDETAPEDDLIFAADYAPQTSTSTLPSLPPSSTQKTPTETTNQFSAAKSSAIGENSKSESKKALESPNTGSSSIGPNEKSSGNEKAPGSTDTEASIIGPNEESSGNEKAPGSTDTEASIIGPNEESTGGEKNPVDRKIRIKRWIDPTDDATHFIRVQCKPSSCNRDLFHMNRFSGLIKGVPKLPDAADEQQPQIQKKYYINLKNQPLKLRLESHDESLTEVDSCIKFGLYMDPNTELELLLEEPKVKNDQQVARGTAQTQAEPVLKQLELIKRRQSDSAAGKWDEFQRCVSDYMPAYKLPKGASEKDADSLTFVLRPRGNPKPGQMAILVRPNEASYLAHLYPTQSFLPDIKQMSELRRHWVLDHDGLYKPKVDLHSVKMEKLLRVSQIDPTQEYFTLTSRWLHVDEPETLEQPILFIYEAVSADWIERIDLQYQRAGDTPNNWVSQMAYKAPTSPSSSRKPSDSASTSKAAEKQAGDADKGKATLVQHQQEQELPKLEIQSPIKLNGIDRSEFRMRLKHYLKAPQQGASLPGAQQPYELIIRSLSLADACSYGRAYCQNQGVCIPTGTAQAECKCDQGYSGKRCDTFHPCEALYGSPTRREGKRSGHEVCLSVGSRCIDQLPVMRCEWPNDEFYQCKRLYKLDPQSGQYLPSGNGISTSDGASSSGEAGGVAAPVDDDPQKLNPEDRAESPKEIIDRQAKLVIILIVFIVAIMIFAVVMIGSLVARLRESSRRLRKSQGEVHELERRMHPSGFNAGSISGGRHATAPKAGTSSVAGYNNSAFDVGS